MLKNFLKSSIYLIALTVVSTVGAVLIKEALAVWTGPTANPPALAVNLLAVKTPDLVWAVALVFNKFSTLPPGGSAVGLT